MGQDDGGAKAPAGAAPASTSPVCPPREPEAQAQAARPGSASLFSSGGNSDATPTKVATATASGGGSRMASPAAVELEMQRLRKEAEESRAWATAVEQERIKSEGENQAQIHQLLAKARLLEEKVALRERQLEQQREEAKAALEKQASALAGGDTALGAAAAAAAAMPEAFGTDALLEEARKRIRELEEEAEEHRADINRLTLLERDARNEVAAVRALLARGGDFYPEVLPVKRMGYVDYDEVKRALEEGRVVKQNSCSQPMVEKALARVRAAILDPSVDVLLRADGHVVGESREHVQLRNLASEFGEPLVDLVLAKKREIEQYNSSGNYIVSVLFSRGREMPLDAAIRRLFLALKKYREALDRKRVSCDIDPAELEWVEAVQLSPQEEDDALFFRATGPRAANVPISASPWSPTAAAAAAAPATSAAASAAFPSPPARPVYSEQPRQQLEAVGSGSGSVGSSGGGGGGGGLAPALLDRFVAHIVGQNRQLATANDYRSKADEFVAAWLRPLRVGPARDEEEFRRLYKQHRESFVARFKANKGQTGADRSRNSAVRYLMQFMGLAENEPLFCPWGRVPPAPQQQAGSGSGAASAQKAGKKKARVESGACPPLRPLAERGGEEEEEDVEVLELGRLRLHIGAPLPRPLRRGFAGWLIERRECAYGVEAEAQIGVLQRLFRQALAVREYKRWCVGLRAGAAAAAEAAEGGGEGWVDLRVAGGSLGDKAAVQAVVMEANLREVIRDEGTQEEKVAMVLLTRWLASAERGEGGSDDGSGGGYGGESDDDEEDSDFGGGGSAKRKRPRPSVGSASSSKVSPISSSALVGSRRIGLTDEMKNRFIDWLLVTKSMNKETAEAYGGRLTSLVGKLLGAQEQALGTIEAVRSFHARAGPIAEKELKPARTAPEKRMVRIWRFFGEFVDDRDTTPPAARGSSSGSGSGSGAGAAIQGDAPLGGPTQEGQQEQENDDEGYMEPDVESINTKEG